MLVKHMPHRHRASSIEAAMTETLKHKLIQLLVILRNPNPTILAQTHLPKQNEKNFTATQSQTYTPQAHHAEPTP
jgi:hypothetical protein